MKTTCDKKYFVVNRIFDSFLKNVSQETRKQITTQISFVEQRQE